MLHDLLHDLRLHANENDVGIANRGEVIGSDGHPQLFSQGAGAIFVSDSGGRQLRREQFFLQ